MATITERKTPAGKKSFQVMIRLRGHPTQTATFSRKTDAKKWAAATESDIREGRYFKTSSSRKHTLGELIDKYIATVIPTKGRMGKDQKTQLLWWKKELGAYLLCDITPPLIADSRDKLLSEITCRNKLRSPATVVRYLAALSHTFSVATREWEWTTINPVTNVRKPKEPSGRIRFLSPDELKRLLKCCQDYPEKHIYVIVVLALATGMRQGEILNIRWQDIDLQREQIVLLKTKNKERRTVPLTGLALDLIYKRHNGNILSEDQLIFGRTDSDQPMNIRMSWDKVVKLAALDNFHFHDLRHTAASYLAMDNASLVELADILGHKTLQMVKRYAHLSDAHTKKVVTRMNKKMFPSDWNHCQPGLAADSGQLLQRSAA